MKKLLCLFGALGLLAFVAMPIYAQEEDVALDDEERIAVEAEDVDAVADEFNEEVEAIADDAVAEIEDAEEAVEDTAEDVAEEATEEVEDFAALLNTDEVQNAFSGFTNEDTYQVIVRHIFNETEIVTVNEYAPAGTQYSIEPLRDKIIDGYEDYH